jgi:hypothetical protein
VISFSYIIVNTLHKGGGGDDDDITAAAKTTTTTTELCILFIK